MNDLTHAQVQRVSEQRFTHALEVEQGMWGQLNDAGKLLVRRAQFAAWLDLRDLGLERRARALILSAVLADALGEGV